MVVGTWRPWRPCITKGLSSPRQAEKQGENETKAVSDSVDCAGTKIVLGEDEVAAVADVKHVTVTVTYALNPKP